MADSKVINLCYFHGFASSPGTTKGRFFADKAATLGLSLQLPDLNAQNFGRITLTRAVEIARQAVGETPPGPVYLIGSSFGARVAMHFLDRYRQDEAARVAKMLFLAPAFEFSFPESALVEWRTKGEIDIYHYGYQKEIAVHYGLVQDIANYDTYSAQTYGVPILIYHGCQDDVVDYQQSVRFAAGRENVRLQMVDSDHLLHDQLERIWEGCVGFFGLNSSG